jgi:hypothetical protein
VGWSRVETCQVSETCIIVRAPVLSCRAERKLPQIPTTP